MALLPHIYYLLHRAIADAFDGCESETDGPMAIVVGNSSEVPERFVDVRWENIYAHGTALFDLYHDPVRPLCIAAQEGCHELYGIVCLEVRRFVGDSCVSGSVRFIEAVPRERSDHVVKNLLGELLFILLCRGSPDEFLTLGIQFRFNLLPYGTPEEICLTE